MIHNEDDYRRAMEIIDEERKRIDGHGELWKRQGMTDDEIKRLRDPMMCVHLQLVEEAEAWRREHGESEDDEMKLTIAELNGGFAILEPRPDGAIYHGRSRHYHTMGMLTPDELHTMGMLTPDELFSTLAEAEDHMFEMSAIAPSDCMGPPPPSRDEIAEATGAVMAVIRGRGLLTQGEESLHRPMAESRRKALWLLEKAVEEILFQDARETS